MARDDVSVAPKERINIVYKSETGGLKEEVELPLRILMIGDYTGGRNETPLEERKPIDVNKQNFNEVLRSQNLSVEMSVDDKLSGEQDSKLGVRLEIQSMKDFTPEGVVSQVEELRRLRELRDALVAVKSPLRENKALRKRIVEMLQDSDKRQQAKKALGLDEGD